MIYRIKQFYEAMTAELTEEDHFFVKSYLTQAEQKIFNKLSTDSQKHCIKVARLLAEQKIDLMSKNELIKLGLLHDIGKIYYPLHPIEKGIMVILNKLTKGRVKRFSKFKMVKGYYEHAELGYGLLLDRGGYSQAFLQAVRDHHVSKPKELITRVLQQADDKC